MTHDLVNPAFLINRSLEIQNTGTTSLQLYLRLVEDSTLRFQAWEAKIIKAELNRRGATA
jgi:hypothetical protein